MPQIIAVVQLADGLVVELPDDTPTFDVPAGFDHAFRGSLDARAGRVLSRRGQGEPFLVQDEWDGSGAPTPRWLLSVREPARDER